MMKDGVLPKEGDVKILQADQDALVDAEAGRLFESKLETLAISACDQGPTLSSDGLMAAEWYRLYGFENCNDNAAQRAAGTSARLSGCEKNVFDRTINMLRSGNPTFNGTQELVNLINAFRPDLAASPNSAGQRTHSGEEGDRTRDRSNNSDGNQTRNDDWDRRMKEIDAQTKESMDRIYKQARDDWEKKKREQESVDDFRGRGTGSPLFKNKN